MQAVEGIINKHGYLPGFIIAEPALGAPRNAGMIKGKGADHFQRVLLLVIGMCFLVEL